ncbi:hypothetical protein D051_1009 [Vibrio parahaemolyticus VPCR-2010]|uniref:hypothetical protein n=1 Tax=Vibrio parahaemolyticus TaxID=670 RepID=UPI00038E4DE6|nr:hypothetical protein D051_1009 [Vibrio parahaemolyticus VPCR-2010]
MKKQQYFITCMMRDKSEPGTVIHFTYRIKVDSLKGAMLLSKAIEEQIVRLTGLVPYSQYTNTIPFTGYDLKDYPLVEVSNEKAKKTVMKNKAGQNQTQLILK